VVVADPASAPLVSLLEAVQFPDLPHVVDGVAAEDGLAAIDFDQVAHGAVGVAGRVENGDPGPVPGDGVGRFDGGRNRHGLGEHEPVGVEVVDIPAALAIVPVALDVVEPHAFGIGDDELRAHLYESRRAAGLVAVMVGEEDSLDLADAEIGQRISNRTITAVE